MKKTERLIGIIYALKENTKLTAKELADIFEISDRTIYRDIDALSQLNVPIRAFEGYGGGYEIAENYFVPSVAFQTNEILYLLICLKIGEIIKVPNMKEDYQSLRYKLLNILDDNTKKKYIKLLERIVFDITRIVPSSYKENVTEKIIESFLQYQDLVIQYYNPRKDQDVERQVTPYTLSFFSGGWYLMGYCHSRKASRAFRLDRIRNIKISEDCYSPSTIDEYMSYDNITKNTTRVKLLMDRPLYEIIKSDSMFLNAKTEHYDSKVELTVYTSELDSIINLAIRNLDEVKIIEPKELINRLLEISRKISEEY